MKNLFKPDRLLYAKTPDTQEETAIPRILTPNDKKACEEMESYAKKPELGAYAKDAETIAKKYRSGLLETKVFEKTRDLLKDPNKMDKKPYQNFVKALANGRFPEKSKNALIFFDHLEGGEEEKAATREILRKLADGQSGKISEYQEYLYFSTINEAVERDQARETLSDTATFTTAIAQSADITSRIAHITENQEQQINNQENWQSEQMDENLREQLNNLDREKTSLMSEWTAKTDQQENLENTLEAEKAKKKPDKAKIKKLNSEIKILSRQRKILDNQIQSLEQKSEKFEKQQQDYLARNVKRFRAINTFSRELGFDINTTKKLKIQYKEEVISDKKTGETIPKNGYIEIIKIDFDSAFDSDLDSANKIKKPDAPGNLVVTYKDVDGKIIKDTCRNFKDYVNANEGHREIDSFEDLNAEISQELGFKNLDVGTEFSTIIPKNITQKPETLGEVNTIKVQGIDRHNKTITLDKIVTTTPREWLNDSLYKKHYYDHKKQVFTFGEFTKFIKQHGYRTDIAIEETEKVCNTVNTEDHFTPPTERQKEFVIFRDENMSVRYGELSLGKSLEGSKQASYSFQELPVPKIISDLDPLKLASYGIPTRLAAGFRARTGFKEAAGKERFAKKVDIGDARTLMQLRENGELVNIPEELKRQFRIVKENDPTSIAAQTMGNKYDIEQPQQQGKPIPTEEAMTDMTDEINPRSKRMQAQEQEPAPSSLEDKTGGLKGRALKYEEALPYDQVYKFGGMKQAEENYLKGLWTSTRFLSGNDIFEWGKAMWEYYVRRVERRQKDKYSSVAKELPFWGPEMKRINQQIETEAMNQFKESFDQKGVFEIVDRLRNTRNRDEFKATMVTMSDKGQLRWDDLELWKSINRFVDPKLAIPIPSNGDPNTRIKEDSNITGFDYLKAAIDSLFGEGQYNDWYQKNKSTYQSNAKGYYEKGKELEGIPGGHARHLEILLRQHKNGDYVNPHEYEGIILHAIDFGKSNMRAKVYYMVEGVAAVNKQGRTILPPDRIAHINSEMLPKFPILEYMTASAMGAARGLDKNGKPIRYPFTLDDYITWVNIFDDGDPQNAEKCKPSAALEQFLWDYVIPSDETQNRINKAIRNGENLDHDDMYAYLPPASEQVLTDACGATVGTKKFLTIEGYANAFPGFSQYFIALAKIGNKNKLREAVKSYVRFEGIMKNRYKKEEGSKYQRMDYNTLNSPPIVSDATPQALMDQMNPMIDQIVYAYAETPAGEKLVEKWELMKTETGDIFTYQDQRKLQNRINDAFETFGDTLNKAIKSDNGERMLAIVKELVNNNGLQGMPFGISDEEREKRKAKSKDAMALE